MASVWRLNIKTAAARGIDPRRFCLDRGILGVGWQVNQSGPVTWDDYIAEARPRYKSRGRSFTVAINAIKHRMQVDDLCWTRDHDGTYYLGVVTSGWRYDSSKENMAADVVNIRSCQWLKAGTVDVVPGKVVNSYISGSTIQKVEGKSVRTYSEYLANQLLSETRYNPAPYASSFLGLLSSNDCEDLLAIYLQLELGYLLVASTCKRDTAAYEYVLRHSITGEKAVAQVKQGAVDLNISSYSNVDANVFLFTTQGRYIGAPSKNVVCINAEKMEVFAINNYKSMPDSIRYWINFDRDSRT